MPMHNTQKEFDIFLGNNKKTVSEHGQMYRFLNSRVQYINIKGNSYQASVDISLEIIRPS